MHTFLETKGCLPRRQRHVAFHYDMKETSLDQTPTAPYEMHRELV